MNKPKKCPHGRESNGYLCKECKALGIGGAGICEHDRVCHMCKECKALGIGGGSICEHKRLRYKCKECKALGIGGAGICEHGHVRSVCVECAGSQICEHERKHSECKECDGSQICQHSKRRCICRDCKLLGVGGNQICKHDRQRQVCSICDPEGTYKRYKNRPERKLQFSLTLEQFISVTSLHCFFCGEDVEPRGVDRWNNKIGYEFNNCRSCCEICNRAKLAMDGPVFVEHFRKLADHTRAVENADDHAAALKA